MVLMLALHPDYLAPAFRDLIIYEKHNNNLCLRFFLCASYLFGMEMHLMSIGFMVDKER